MADIKTLLEGYQKFYQQHFIDDNRLFSQLSQGQSPKTLIITCSDSRISPLEITRTNPGDVFVIRNVANLVPPYQPNPDSLHGVSAALEFGVCHLEVENIIIMGHSGCGGIQALREGISAPEGQEFSFIAPWVEIAQSAKCDSQSDCEQAAVKISLQNLLSFPWIRSRVEAGRLQLHGWYFRIADGKLLTLENEEFVEAELAATTSPLAALTSK